MTICLRSYILHIFSQMSEKITLKKMRAVLRTVKPMIIKELRTFELWPELSGSDKK